MQSLLYQIEKDWYRKQPVISFSGSFYLSMHIGAGQVWDDKYEVWDDCGAKLDLTTPGDFIEDENQGNIAGQECLL